MDSKNAASKRASSSAREDDDSYIDIPNVRVCNCVLTVRVGKEFKSAIATVDADGVII